MTLIDHPYKPRTSSMALAVLFFGTCCLPMAHAAMSNHRGLVLDGVIQFSTRGATVFYECIAAVSGLFVIVGVPAFLVSLVSSHRLILSNTSLSAPRHGFSRRPTVVALSSITGMRVHVVRRHCMLSIRHQAGVLNIMQSWLPNEAAFDELRAVLARGVKSRS